MKKSYFFIYDISLFYEILVGFLYKKASYEVSSIAKEQLETIFKEDRLLLKGIDTKNAKHLRLAFCINLV